MEYVSRLEQKEISVDEKSLRILDDRGAAITVLYASDGVGENYPIHFFDVAYDADTGITYFSRTDTERTGRDAGGKKRNFREQFLQKKRKHL